MSTAQITAQDLYAAQILLREMESRSEQWDYDETVEANKLRETVYEGQQSFNGEIFRIPEAQIEKLTDKLAKIAKRCEKLGVTAPTLTDTGVREDQNIGSKKVTEIHRWAYVAVTGETPSLNGWHFVATLQHEEHGTILRRVPTPRLDPELREKFEQHIVSIDKYRTAKPVCDHCQKIRQRKDTYVVVHEDGETRQVGTNCLADFLGGLSPQRAAKGFEYIFRALDEARTYEREGFTGLTVDPTYDAEYFLSHVVWAYNKFGWLPRSKAYDGKIATADRAANNMFAQIKQERIKGTFTPAWEDPSDEDLATAKATITYIRDEWDNDSDFGHNLTTILYSDEIKYRSFGIAAAAVLVYKRDMEKKVQEAAAVKEVNNEHVGSIKDRIDLKLTPTKIFVTDGAYGTVYIHTLRDEAGHVFKWFGSYRLDTDIEVEGKWTVKKHGEYKGVKETVINRPKLKEATPA